MKKQKSFILILAVIAGFFWGSVGPFVRYMSGLGISSLTILASRVLVAALMLGLGMTFSASAAGYSSQISSITLDYSLSNSRCDSAAQQSVNGLYRSVELLELIAKKWD